MKPPSRLMLLVGTCILLTTSILAQQAETISQLKEQVQRMSAIDQNPAVPSSVKIINRGFLEERRAHLRALFKNRIDALWRYLSTMGTSLTPQEKQVVQNSITSLEAELKGLENDINGNSPAPSSVSSADSSANVEVTDSLSLPQQTATGTSTLPSLSIDCSRCDLPDKALVIDASTGKIYWHDASANPVDRDKVRFSKGDRITVVVINKNPFLFKYNISIQETAITEEALVPFLKVFSSIFTNVATAATSMELDPADFTACPQDKRKNAELAYNKIRDDLHSLSAKIETTITNATTSNFSKIKAKYLGVESKYNAATPKLSRTKAAPNESLCRILCDTANDLAGTLNGYNPEPEFKTFQTNVESLKTQADTINGEINDFVSSYPECQPRDNGLSVLREVQVLVQNFSNTTVPNVLNDLNQMRDNNKEFVKMRDNINMLASRPDLLQDQRIIGPYVDPTNVSVKVEAKSINAPDTEAFKPITEAKLNFGGDKRFALSGGVAYGFLDRQEIKPILGFERDRQGNLVAGQTTPSTVIGVTNDIKRRIGPVLMLNTRLTNYQDNNLFISLGINGTSDNTGVNIDYLIGPSFNFLDRKVFLTYGLYGGSVQRLNQDLYLGLKIPDGTSADKLVKKDFTWKSGFAVTYKIK